jgi:hypothetical protein
MLADKSANLNVITRSTAFVHTTKCVFLYSIKLYLSAFSEMNILSILLFFPH